MIDYYRVDQTLNATEVESIETNRWCRHSDKNDNSLVEVELEIQSERQKEEENAIDN